MATIPSGDTRKRTRCPRSLDWAWSVAARVFSSVDVVMIESVTASTVVPCSDAPSTMARENMRIVVSTIALPSPPVAILRTPVISLS